ncbi:Coiled-coil domain-containing protein 89 [Lonchura striata]|uniref:Coiled-coil domain-containing protein 89 n=1 Tax=Lonchura striata TaxID=40157 RepID=A0A218UJC8_9PASE|nr:Coiled-coil domain-containing protein 89 [Lonchura striata domestica]
MADFTGDPETGKEVEDLTKNLEELCESSKEQSEEVLLLSCLEQHHHLGSILKKKVDDTHKHCRDLEQLNIELEKLRGEDAVKIKTQTQCIQHLEGCFMDLVKNHEKMVQFKNEHKYQHMQLWEESKCLWQDREALFSKAVRRRKLKSKALQHKEWEIQKLEEKLETMEEAMKRAGRFLKKEAAAVDKDLKVQELQGQIECTKQAYNELLLHFNAYRRHSMDLLTKEF